MILRAGIVAIHLIIMSSRCEYRIEQMAKLLLRHLTKIRGGDTMTPKDKRHNEESRGKRGEDAMFNLTSSKDTPIRDERYDMDAGLERFQKETGINFLDAIRNKRTIVKKLVDGSDNHDTDDDELENQRIYGPFQERLIRESD